MKIITATNFRELTKQANEENISKKDIISLMDRNGQLVLIYE